MPDFFAQQDHRKGGDQDRGDEKNRCGFTQLDADQAAEESKIRDHNPNASHQMHPQSTRSEDGNPSLHRDKDKQDK